MRKTKEEGKRAFCRPRVEDHVCRKENLAKMIVHPPALQKSPVYYEAFSQAIKPGVYEEGPVTCPYLRREYNCYARGKLGRATFEPPKCGM